MTTVLYANIQKMADAEIQKQANRLPYFMIKDISRFRQAKTRKLKMTARLMLLYCLENSGQGQLINKWQITEHQKPVIEGWLPFNISHSSDLAVFAYGDELVGVDIEKIDEVKIDVLEYFHPLEQRYISNSIFKKSAFYEIWAKKEAFLKALGNGLSHNEGLDSFSCVDDAIFYQGHKWFFFELEIDPDYKSYLCCQKVDDVKIAQFNLITT